MLSAELSKLLSNEVLLSTVFSDEFSICALVGAVYDELQADTAKTIATTNAITVASKIEENIIFFFIAYHSFLATFYFILLL